jgi:hypothetical protein
VTTKAITAGIPTTTPRNIDGFARLAQSVGNAFADMYNFIAENMSKIANNLMNTLETISPAFAKFVADSWVRLNNLMVFMSEVFSKIGESLAKFGEVIAGFSVGAFDVVMQGIGKAGELAGRGLDYLRESGITVTDVLRNLVGPITTLIIVFGGLSGPIGWVISALTFLVTRTNIVSDSIKALKGEKEKWNFLK